MFPFEINKQKFKKFACRNVIYLPFVMIVWNALFICLIMFNFIHSLFATSLTPFFLSFFFLSSFFLSFSTFFSYFYFLFSIFSFFFHFFFSFFFSFFFLFFFFFLSYYSSFYYFFFFFSFFFFFCSWCNELHRRNYTRWPKFKSWPRLFAFHIANYSLSRYR